MYRNFNRLMNETDSSISSITWLEDQHTKNNTKPEDQVSTTAPPSLMTEFFFSFMGKS